jgi:AcrR family transcriptional regulator
MQDLADALGLQKGSLYYYIHSKEELLRRLLERATSCGPTSGSPPRVPSRRERWLPVWPTWPCTDW